MKRRGILRLFASAAASVAARPLTIAWGATQPVYAPILMYHHVSNTITGRFATTPAAFAEQMRWLADNGFESVSVEAIASAVRGESRLPARPIAITFDDGWRSQFTDALPVLEANGLQATFFVVSNYIVPGPVFMDWKVLENLIARGHMLGSHSGRHIRQTTLGPGPLALDMLAARVAIQQHLGLVVTAHAFPYGAVNAAVEAAAQRAGYFAAVGVEAGTAHTPGRLFRLNRVEVRGGMTMEKFAAAVLGTSPPSRAPRQEPPPPCVRGGPC